METTRTPTDGTRARCLVGREFPSEIKTVGATMVETVGARHRAQARAAVMAAQAHRASQVATVAMELTRVPEVTVERAGMQIPLTTRKTVVAAARR